MKALVIGIILIRNIDPNLISSFKPFHWLILLLHCPVSYDWYRRARDSFYDALTI